MSPTASHSRKRYAPLDETEYVLDTTSVQYFHCEKTPGKRVVQEPVRNTKRRKLGQDDVSEAHKALGDFTCGIEKIRRKYPIVEVRPGISNEMRDAQERAEEKIVELEWSQIEAAAQFQAKQQELHLESSALADLRSRCQDAEEFFQQTQDSHAVEVSGLEGRIQEVVDQIRGTEDQCRNALALQEGTIENRNNTIVSLDQEARTQREAKEDAEAQVQRLTQHLSSLEKKVDQQDDELDDFRRRNKELAQSQWQNTVNTVDAMANDALTESYDEADRNLSEAESAVTRLHTVACPEDGLDLDTSMADLEPKSIPKKCEEVVSELQHLREQNDKLREAKSAAEEAKSAAEKEATQAQKELDDFMSEVQEQLDNDERNEEVRKQHEDSFVQHDPRDDIEFYDREQVDGDMMDSSTPESGTDKEESRPTTAASLTSSISSNFKSSWSMSTTSQSTAATAPSPHRDEELNQMSQTPLPTPKSMFSSSCGGSELLTTTTPSALASKKSSRGSMRDIGGKPQHRSNKYTPGNVPEKGSIGKTVSASEKRKASAKVKERLESMFEPRDEKDPETTKYQIICQIELGKVREWCAKAGPAISKAQSEQEKRKRRIESVQNWLDHVLPKHHEFAQREKELLVAIDGENMLLKALGENAVFGRNSEHFFEAPSEYED